MGARQGPSLCKAHGEGGGRVAHFKDGKFLPEMSMNTVWSTLGAQWIECEIPVWGHFLLDEDIRGEDCSSKGLLGASTVFCGGDAAGIGS